MCLRGSVDITCRSPASAQSIELSDLRTRRSTKYAPTPKTIVSVGSVGASVLGSHRKEMRVEIFGAIAWGDGRTNRGEEGRWGKKGMMAC